MECLDHRSDLLDQAKQISYPKDPRSDNTIRTNFHMVRKSVGYRAPVTATFAIERITDTAGHILRGGSGASCWGYNQSNNVRHGDILYALSWRDDLSIVLYCRIGTAPWQVSPPLPPVPQNGNVLVDEQGRAHVISGDGANWHAVFENPGQLQTFKMRQYAKADSRFGAAINKRGQIFVAGGLAQMAWYVLEPSEDYRAIAQDAVPHPEQRGYNFTVFADTAGHAFSSDDYFVRGEQFPNSHIKRPNPDSGEIEVIETERGIYPVLKTYYYYNPDVFASPTAWQMTVISDVADTYNPADGGRGTTEQQDLLIDDEGLVHLIYFENRQVAHTIWASSGQDVQHSQLYHAVGPPEGPFEHFCLGSFNSGRLYQTADGYMHYLLTRGRRGAAQELWYARGTTGDWAHISAPVKLEMPAPFWHLYINTQRTGGTQVPFIDCYWTGAYENNSNEVWYGRLDVGLQ